MIEKNLRTIRRRRNLTQQQLADLLGVTRSYISLVESGASKLSTEQKNKIELLWNIDLSNILEEPPEPTDEQLREGWKQKLDITDSQMDILEKIIMEDKELVFLLCRAWSGDHKAVKSLLSILKDMEV